MSILRLSVSNLFVMPTRDRVIHVTPVAYHRLAREAGRRGVPPDALAGQLLAAELAPVKHDLTAILGDLAEIRGRVRRSRRCGRYGPLRAAKSLIVADFDARSRREYCRGAVLDD